MALLCQMHRDKLLGGTSDQEVEKIRAMVDPGEGVVQHASNTTAPALLHCQQTSWPAVHPSFRSRG